MNSSSTANHAERQGKGNFWEPGSAGTSSCEPTAALAAAIFLPYMLAIQSKSKTKRHVPSRQARVLLYRYNWNNKPSVMCAH